MKLRALREERLWTQRELAKRAGVGARTVSAAESEEYPVRMSTRRKLLKALGLSIYDHEKVFGPLRRPKRVFKE